MTLVRSLAFAFAFGVALIASAAAQDDHQAHHPASAASAAGPTQKAPATTSMDGQMQSMQAMHDKMMAAKTPKERQALMAEHMKLMQDGMATMNGMKGGDMPADPAARQRALEMRMDMMQSMMQMMMDRMGEPTK